MYAEIISTIITIIIVFCVFIKKKYSYWAKYGIESIPAVFPYGSMKDSILLKKNIGVTLAEFYRKFDTKKQIGFYAPFSPMLLIRDPELIRSVLVKEFNSFTNTGFTARKDIDPLLAYNPFGETGYERWKASRSILTPMLTISRIKTMTQDIMIKSANNLTKYLMTKPGESFEVKKLVNSYLTDAVIPTVFGIESDSFFNTSESFTKYTGGDLFLDSSEANYASLSGMLFPFINRIFRWRTISKHIELLLTNIGSSTMEHRKANGIVRGDILEHIMAMNEKTLKETGKPFSRGELSAHFLAIYGDGVDTSGTILTAAIYNLAVYSQMQEKLREEITASLKNINDLDYDKMQSFEYLEMFISESFRHHPPIPFISRTCTQEIVLDGVKIEPGVKVFIPTLGIHMDSKYYPEPEKFLPERFAKEKRNDIPKFAFLPFSEGPRMCLGFRYAQAEIKVAVIALLLKFRLQLSNKTLKLEKDPGSVFILTSKGNVDVLFTPL